MSATEPSSLGPRDSWAGVRVVVVGFDPAGFAAADNLMHLGAAVTALDTGRADDERQEKAQLLRMLGADVRLGPDASGPLPDPVDLVIASARTDPGSGLLEQATRRGVPVWGEVELAWRLRDPDRRAPWLAVTGSRGASTAAAMLRSVLRSAGLRTIVAGESGLPCVEVVMDPTPYDVLTLHLTGTQLLHTESMSAEAAVVLNVAAGDPDGGRTAGFGRIYEHVRTACVYNVADPATEQLVRDADVVEGARAIGFTLDTPGVGMVGLVEDILADRAFIADRETSAAELATTADLGAAAPEYVGYALAAAALARAHGVSQQAIREGLRTYRPAD